MRVRTKNLNNWFVLKKLFQQELIKRKQDLKDIVNDIIFNKIPTLILYSIFLFFFLLFSIPIFKFLDIINGDSLNLLSNFFK